MNRQTLRTIRTTEELVTQLVDECAKSGPLYRQNPKLVAQVSRTGKWLLNAIAALQREIDKPAEPEEQTQP
jgi:hypothetical protein